MSRMTRNWPVRVFSIPTFLSDVDGICDHNLQEFRPPVGRPSPGTVSARRRLSPPSDCLCPGEGRVSSIDLRGSKDRACWLDISSLNDLGCLVRTADTWSAKSRFDCLEGLIHCPRALHGLYVRLTIQQTASQPKWQGFVPRHQHRVRVARFDRKDRSASDRSLFSVARPVARALNCKHRLRLSEHGLVGRLPQG